MNKADQSKLKLTEAMLDLLAQKPFGEITIQNIVDRAGVSRMAFYRNYRNKLEIVKIYLDEVTSNFIKEKHVDYHPEYFHEYLVILFTHLQAQEKLGRLLYKSNLLYLVKDQFDRIFANKAHDLREEYNYRFVAGVLYNIYSFWLANGCQETPEELAEMLA